MLLPAALPLALWGRHFLNNLVSADLLIDHCGANALEVISRHRGKEMGLAVVAPGDLAGIASPSLNIIVEAGSAVVFDDHVLLPPDWRDVEGSRAVAPTRAQAEQLLISALSRAHDHFLRSPIFGIGAPVIPEISFPPSHPPKLRELLNRAATTLAIATSLTDSWQSMKLDAVDSEEILREMKFAARRGFEAGVMF